VSGNAFGFTLHSVDGLARRGEFIRQIGDVLTPGFMQVVSLGSV
jgi:queuine/archaeosine tRNA-ribosyltransferase